MKYSLYACLHFALIFLIFQSVGYIFPNFITSCCACNLTLSLLFWVLTFRFTKKKFLDDVIDPYKKAVFITGCDTGFGHELAKRLDSKGYHVFAGCLFPTGPDATSLTKSCSQRLKVVEIDVSKDDSVEKAVEFVKENLNNCDLWAVVNNAGIQRGFSVEITELSEFQECMEVNGFGPVRVTKAFLPLLKKTKGRVVTVTSLNGRVIFPHMTPYTMSKFAAVGFSDCLRQELDKYGVQVISIEPEGFKTNITKKELIEENLERTLRKSEKTMTKDERDKNSRLLKKYINFLMSFTCSRINLVIDDLEHAITSEYPDCVYKTRRNIFFRVFLFCFENMPIYFRDLIVKIALTISMPFS